MRRTLSWVVWAVAFWATLKLAEVPAFVGHEYLTWLPHASEFAREFFWQRWAFSVAIMTDVPLAQLVLLGISFVWTAALVRQRCVTEKSQVRKGHDSIPVPSFPKLDSSQH